MSYVDELVVELQPYIDADPTGGRDTLAYIAGVAAMAEPIASLVRDADGRPGWSDMFDPWRCPRDFLMIPAQVKGVVLNPSDSEEVQRAKIDAGDGISRGSITAQIIAAQSTLTGAKTVIPQERFNGNAWRQRFITRPAETPSPDLTLAAIKSQKPVGIVALHEVFDGITWDDLAGLAVTWADVASTFSTWEDVRLDNH